MWQDIICVHKTSNGKKTNRNVSSTEDAGVKHVKSGSLQVTNTEDEPGHSLVQQEEEINLD